MGVNISISEWIAPDRIVRVNPLSYTLSAAYCMRQLSVWRDNAIAVERLWQFPTMQQGSGAEFSLAHPWECFTLLSQVGSFRSSGRRAGIGDSYVVMISETNPSCAVALSK